jgi:transposase
MAARARRAYTEQFKADSVKLASKSDKTVRQVARDLQIEPGLLHTWIRQQGKSGGGDIVKAPPGETLEEEVRRLRRELANVTDERNFLKKATAYFAKENK